MRRLHEEASVTARALLNRRMAPALAVATLVAVCVVIGLVLGNPDWTTPVIALGVAGVGMVFGVRGGFIAAFVASAVFLIWAIAHDGYDTGDLLNHRYVLY